MRIRHLRLPVKGAYDKSNNSIVIIDSNDDRLMLDIIGYGLGPREKSELADDVVKLINSTTGWPTEKEVLESIEREGKSIRGPIYDKQYIGTKK